MTDRRPSETINPASTLRELRDQMTLEQRAKLEAAQAAFSLLSVDQLRSQNSELFKEPLSPHVPRPIALLWLINLELTKRGIGPRWRGAPAYIAPEAAPALPPLALVTGQPRPMSYADRGRAMLRWIDLEWLCCQLGPDHTPEQGSWRDIFKWGLSEGVATQIAHSPSNPHRLTERLGVSDMDCFALRGLFTQGCAKRLKTLNSKRLKSARGALLRDADLTPDQRTRRLLWIEAIELADGSPTDAARYFGWMTGTRPSRQSAAEMRKKLASQLGFRTGCWRQK